MTRRGRKVSGDRSAVSVTHRAVESKAPSASGLASPETRPSAATRSSAATRPSVATRPRPATRTAVGQPGIATVDAAGAWWDRQAAYRSSEIWAEECRLFWRRSWQAVALSDDLEGHGAFTVVAPSGEPVTLVRDGNVIRALSNVCRHRAMRLCEGSGTTGSLRCAYHGWRYGLDGELQAVPQRTSQFPGIDLSGLALESFAVRSWMGLVLVRLDGSGDAPPFGPQHHEQLALAMVRHSPDVLPVVGRHRLVAHCNWKLLVENHIDAYHLWYLHRDSLDAYDHRSFDAHWWPDGTWVSWEPFRGELIDSTGLVQVPGAPAGMGAHLVFPGLLVVTSPWWLATYWLDSVAPDRTEIQLVVRGPSGSDVDVLVAAVRHFVDQDVWACEAVQQALAARSAREGPLARGHETHVVAFRRLVGEALDRAG